MTSGEVYRSLLSFLPRGLPEKLGPQLHGVLEASATALKQECADVIDLLRREAAPSTAVLLLPEWEAALALVDTVLSRFGTITQRQAQVVAALRFASGSLSLPDLKAALSIVLDTAPSNLTIAEPDRDALRAAHSYPGQQSNVAIIPFGVGAIDFDCLDTGRLSDAGLQVDLVFSGSLAQVTFSVFGPNANQETLWGSATLGRGTLANEGLRLYARVSNVRGQVLQQSVTGPWTLLCRAGVAGATLHSASLFVEAIDRYDAGEGLGAAAHVFAVVVDPAQLGAQADVPAARALLQRAKPGWMNGVLVLKNAALGGGTLAIPDLPETLPDASIPG